MIVITMTSFLSDRTHDTDHSNDDNRAMGRVIESMLIMLLLTANDHCDTRSYTIRLLLIDF